MGHPSEEALLHPEIFEAARQVPASLMAVIARRLELVASARGGVLHACNAFNALYFDYDPQLRRYIVEPDPDAFVSIPIGGPLPQLPVGAFVRLTRGTRELWGEVAGVFGAAEGVERDGWTTGAQSGCPAAGSLDRQRIVVDTDVFGPLLAEELVERGRWLRPGGGLEGGHLVGFVPAAAHGISARDQASLFAAYLAGPGRPLLDLGPLPGWLGREASELTEEEIVRSVRAAVGCLSHIMEGASGLRMWGLQGRSAGAAAGFAASSTARDVWNAVTRPAPGGSARYSALWPLLSSLHGETDRAGELVGVAGAALVVDANLAIADAVTMNPPGVDIRVDDIWQQGGIWRAQALPVDDLFASLDPLIPAGIGFAEYQATRQHEAPRARHGAYACEMGQVDVVHIDDELVVVTVALSVEDLRTGRLPLGHSVLELLPSGDRILSLHHDGGLAEELAEQRVRSAGDAVHGLMWPPGIPPGLRLTVAAARAGRRLVATSVRLPQPFEVPGFGTIAWEYDEELFACGTGISGRHPASSGWEPWPPSVAPGSWRPAVAALEHLVIEALKRDGDDGPAGSRRLDGRRLTAALFGPDVHSPALLWTVIHTCEDMAVLGLLTRVPGVRGPDVFTWWPTTPEALQARAAAAAWGQRPEQPLTRHWVRPQHRRLPHGQQPSPESRRDYAQWRLEVEGANADTELPPGTTFVHGHLRGPEPGKPWHRHVPQHQERRFGNG
ncbi:MULTISPECIES: hypothetical protein [unclassified Streptomyces]|uniref:hypothetical protein n=1 Tax=unclassified Streptomyces TaxID=2593676 RepID=UPI003249B0CF